MELSIFLWVAVLAPSVFSYNHELSKSSTGEELGYFSFRSWTRAPVEKLCEDVPTVKHGTISEGASYIGSTRMVKCKPSYVLRGPNMVLCTAAGWTRPGKCTSLTDRFYLIKDMMSWYEAVVRCASTGDRLAMPRSVVDTAIIIHLMRRQHSQLAWIGLYRMSASSGPWRWIDGSPLSDSDYKAWLPGEPNNVNERCAQFHLVESISDKDPVTGGPQYFGWNNFYCSHNQTNAVINKQERTLHIGAICERPTLSSRSPASSGSQSAANSDKASKAGSQSAAVPDNSGSAGNQSAAISDNSEDSGSWSIRNSSSL